MRRKETKLETNLITKGFKLSHKVYTGKHSDKIFSYIYIKENRACVYEVSLDKTRDKIIGYQFNTCNVHEYTYGIIDGLKEVLDGLKTELNDIYDFEQEVAKDYEEIKLEDLETNFDNYIEEAMFDE